VILKEVTGHVPRNHKHLSGAGQSQDMCVEGIAREMRDSTQAFAWSVRSSGRREVYRGGRRELDLISATIGRHTIGDETALQLIMPIWQ